MCHAASAYRCRERIVISLYDTAWIRAWPACHVCLLLSTDVGLTLTVILTVVLLAALSWLAMSALGLGWTV